MVKCIKQVPLERVFRHRAKYGHEPAGIKDIPEDVYFSHALEVLDNDPSEQHTTVWATVEQARQFSVEGMFHRTPVGLHGFDKDFMGMYEMESILGDSVLGTFVNQSASLQVLAHEDVN